MGYGIGLGVGIIKLGVVVGFGGVIIIIYGGIYVVVCFVLKIKGFGYDFYCGFWYNYNVVIVGWNVDG